MGDRGYGEGGLHWSEGRQRWVATWRGRKQYGRTKTEAARKLKAMREGGAAGTRLRTVGDLLDWWTGEHLPHRLAAGGIAHGTVKDYLYVATLWTPLRRARLDELTAADVDRILDQLATTTTREGRGYSPSKRRAALVALRQAFKAARAKGLIPRARTAPEDATTPTVPVTEPPLVTPDVVRAVLAQLEGHRDLRLIVVTLALGLRLGEALGMTWDHVDLDAATVRIHQQLQRQAGRWVITPTKTHADVTLALPKLAVTALREQRRVQAEERLAAGPAWQHDPQLGDLVWRRADGQPVWGTFVTKTVAQACEDAGVGRMGMHAFARHGKATLMLLGGGTLDDVRHELRHRQASTTVRYAHVVPEVRRRNAALMDDILDRAT